MTIFPKLSDYFKSINLFRKNSVENSREELSYIPELAPIPTPTALISTNNYNIFDSDVKLKYSTNFNNNFLFNLNTSPNFDLFAYKGLDGVSLASEKSNDTTYSLNWWKEQGYNEEKGQALAKKARSLAKKKSQGICATYVRRAINKTFYSNEKGEHYKSFKKACVVGDEFLVNDKNFKKIEVDMSKIKPEDIPTGAIVIYPSKGYSKNSAGHIEIADELKVNKKGEAVRSGISDYTSKSLCQNWGKRKDPAEIWIPV